VLGLPLRVVKVGDAGLERALSAALHGWVPTEPRMSVVLNDDPADVDRDQGRR